MPKYSDKEILDWLQNKLAECRYSGKVIWRWSINGHGWRLYETTMKGSVDSVREAITSAMEEEIEDNYDETPIQKR